MNRQPTVVITHADYPKVRNARLWRVTLDHSMKSLHRHTILFLAASLCAVAPPAAANFTGDGTLAAKSVRLVAK